MSDAFSVALSLFEAKPISVWEPYPKQQMATELAGRTFELLYGGAAGGGKSSFLRGYGVNFCINNPGAHVGLIRKTLPMLKQTHGLHLTTLTTGYAIENRAESVWRFTNGSVMRFISLQNEGDEQNYKSVEFDLLLFDEVTEILESQYTFMLSRVRSAKGYRAHAVASANPEGRGFRWVKRRWVSPRPTDLAPDQAPPNATDIWAPPILEDGVHTGWHPSRCFLPATVEDNPGLLAANPTYVQQLKALPDGRMRRALLYGDWEAMDQVPGALWDQSNIDEHRVMTTPDNLLRIVIGVDPTGSSSAGADECGIVVVGVAPDGRYYVLRDESGQLPPVAWANRIKQLFDETQADRVVVERNYGGDMVEATLRTASPTLPVKMVNASRGKAVRAEPISTLYKQGRVRHVGYFMEMEDQMCTWTQSAGWSPDRMDALVWAITELSGGGLLAYLNAQAKVCPQCGLPNLSQAVACFRCSEPLVEAS